jgi:DHA1 family bicyclomycin/chloramphenicol resistance-like MFS transporter
VFVVLAVLALLMILMAARAVPETLPAARRSPVGLRNTLRTYRGLLRDRTFVGLVLVAGLAMAGLFGYVAGSSFVFQEEFGLDEQQFGFLFGAGAIFLIGGTQLNAALLRWFEPRMLLPFALALAVVAGAVLITLSVMNVGGLVGVLAPLWTVLFATGLVMPNAPTLALARHGESAGTAAALLGAIQMGVGAVVSPVVGVLGNDAVAMGLVMGAGAALGLAVLLIVVRPWTLADLDA